MTDEQERVKAHILALFGGLTAVARICGLKSASAVFQWRGVPSRHQPALLEYARQNGIDLAPEDLFSVRKAVPVAKRSNSRSNFGIAKSP